MSDAGFAVIGTIFCTIFGYLIGSINWSIILSKKIYNIDIREHSSKNAGATNTSRVLGVWMGLLVFFLDVIKPMLAIILAFLISLIPISGFAGISYYIPAFGVIIGHCWPIWFKFKGGKAVSPFIGLTICVNIIYFLIFSAVWWLLYFIFKKVSLSSICAAVSVMAWCWLPAISGFEGFPSFLIDVNNVPWQLNFMNFHKYAVGDDKSFWFCFDSWYIANLIILISSIILIFKHRANINRLIDGKESDFHFTKDAEIKKEKKNKTKKDCNEQSFFMVFLIQKIGIH